MAEARGGHRIDTAQTAYVTALKKAFEVAKIKTVIRKAKPVKDTNIKPLTDAQRQEVEARSYPERGWRTFIIEG